VRVLAGDRACVLQNLFSVDRVFHRWSPPLHVMQRGDHSRPGAADDINTL